MKRHEVSAIIGAYSRQGFAAEAVAGGFLVTGTNVCGYRSMKQARRDTGVYQFIRAARAEYRAALNFDLR